MSWINLESNVYYVILLKPFKRSWSFWKCCIMFIKWQKLKSILNVIFYLFPKTGLASAVQNRDLPFECQLGSNLSFNQETLINQKTLRYTQLDMWDRALEPYVNCQLGLWPVWMSLSGSSPCWLWDSRGYLERSITISSRPPGDLHYGHLEKSECSGNLCLHVSLNNNHFS